MKTGSNRLIMDFSQTFQASSLIKSKKIIRSGSSRGRVLAINAMAVKLAVFG